MKSLKIPKGPQWRGSTVLCINNTILYIMFGKKLSDYNRIEATRTLLPTTFTQWG